MSVPADEGASRRQLPRPDHDPPRPGHPPPLKLRPEAWPEYQRRWEAERTQQPSQRIPVEHTIAKLKWWRQLQRYTARRQLLPETINAIAGLVSDRTLTW